MAYDKVVDSAKLEAGLTSIADAIRNHVEDPGPPRVCQFPEDFVTGVADAYANGHTIGHEEGSSAGYEIGYSEGKQSEREAFWNGITENGTRTNYNYGFYGTGWNDISFRPTRDIVIGSANSTFRGATITDMVALLKECGVALDFSSCTLFTSTFYGMTTTTLPVIDTSSCGALTSPFASMANLKSIEKLILKSNGSTTFSNPFQNTPDLEDIVIEGVIGQNGFAVSVCTKLTHDSLMSIINALKDYAGSGTTKTVTLGSTNLAKLTAEEKKIATDKGWTLA